MYDYGFFSYDSKADFLDRSRGVLEPRQDRFWQDAGIDLVIDRREGYLFWDMAGRRLIDLHLNGGTYNLGHRNPELIATLEQAMGRFDIGNHHFPALARTALAEALVEDLPAEHEPGGVRLRRRRGHRHRDQDRAPHAPAAQDRLDPQGLPRPHRARRGHRRRPLLDAVPVRPPGRVRPGAVQRPRRDGGRAARQRRGRGAASRRSPPRTASRCPSRATCRRVKRLCERYGALYIADEVQTGLMRTGEMWAIAKAGIEPDIMVIGKGITGGMYPIACTVVSEECSAWLKEDGFGHISTGGGAELGCIVALKVLEICGRPEVRSMVHYIADRFRRGLRAIQELYPDWLVGIRQDGVVMGLEFDHPQGAKIVMRHLYEHGVWAIFSTLDPRVLQFKPGILLGPELVDEILDRTEVAIELALRRGARRPGASDGGERDERRRLAARDAGRPRARG